MSEPFSREVIYRSCYQTSDGELFTDIEKARAHQAKLDVLEWYQDNELCSNASVGFVELEDLLDWIRKHKQTILKLL